MKRVLLDPILRLLIYERKRHPRSFRDELPQQMVDLCYRTREGDQHSFYLPPSHLAPNEPPERLIVYFAGNTSNGTKLLGVAEDLKIPTAGHLFIEYPGFGINAGLPTRDGITNASIKALEALCEHLSCSEEQLLEDMRILGYSMGAATCLEFALRKKAKGILLLAPFTSIYDMAVRRVGRPLASLVPDRYDNKRAIRRLSEQHSPPEIHVLHALDDDIIPVSMGKHLGRLGYPNVHLHVFERGGHKDLLDVGRQIIVSELRR